MLETKAIGSSLVSTNVDTPDEPSSPTVHLLFKIQMQGDTYMYDTDSIES